MIWDHHRLNSEKHVNTIVKVESMNTFHVKHVASSHEGKVHCHFWLWSGVIVSHQRSNSEKLVNTVCQNRKRVYFQYYLHADALY